MSGFALRNAPQRALGRRAAWPSLILASVLFTLSLGFAYEEMNKRESLSEPDLGHYTHNLFQTYHELTRFLSTLRRYALEDPTMSVTHDEVELRFEILVSRIPLFTEGESNRMLPENPEARDFLQALTAALTLVEPRLERLPPDTNDPDYRLIMDALEPLAPRLFDLVRQFLIRIEDRSDEIIRSVDHGFAYLLAPVLTGGVLLLLFTAQLRRSQRLARALAEETLQLHAAGARLAHQAGHDPLTDLANRALFIELLGQGLARARRTGGPLAVLFLDLDRFKPVNDSMGHGVGDDLLRIVATRLVSSVRESDIVARMGGDEFVVLLEGLDEAGQRDVAQRLLDILNLPIPIAGQDVFIGASMGVSRFPEDGDNAEQLMSNADAAMYSAKRSGRDMVVFYTSAMNADAKERLALESRLRHALANDELELHYQPQVMLADGRVTGVEALLRWRDPERGLVPPVEFIPMAEASGLIVQFDDWALRAACRQAAQWRRDGLKPLLMAVNVSARRFQIPDLVERVAATLAETGLEPQWLELELTESVLLHDVETAIEAMHRLSALGVRLAIDDFGTGYSSLNYLQRFPVNRLKIDRAFVRAADHQSSTGAIARAVIALSKSLEIEVLAEGVETEEERDFLRAHGCDEGQGYLFGRPMPAEAIAALLRPPVHRSWSGLPVYAGKTDLNPEPAPDVRVSYQTA